MRPEARLERAILQELGREPDVLLLKNEVGQGYYGTIYPQIQKALARWPEARRAVEEILVRNRLTYGLGVGSPDLLALVRLSHSDICVATGLELKSERGALRESQERWHAAARARVGFRTSETRSVEDARHAVERARG